MLDRLRSLISGGTGSPPGSPGDQVTLAAAALLVEVAMIDGAMEARERERIALLLRERFGLSPFGAEAAVEQAIALQDRSSEMFPFTKIIVDHFDPKERIELIEMAWEVAYANGRLHDYQANLMRRMTGLLYVSDHDSGSARLHAMANLGISDRP
jgi:uncharacterized tellurite resistance protein B-like protein